VRWKRFGNSTGMAWVMCYRLRLAGMFHHESFSLCIRFLSAKCPMTFRPDPRLKGCRVDSRDTRLGNSVTVWHCACAQTTRDRMCESYSISEVGAGNKSHQRPLPTARVRTTTPFLGERYLLRCAVTAISPLKWRLVATHGYYVRQD
jgi:hypothetical protein